MSEVTITMSSETVTALRDSGSSLYALKAAGSSNAAGRPLVWYSTAQFLETNLLSWTTPFSVYVAPPLAGSGPVVPGNSTVIAPGQVWRLTKTGAGVFNGGPPADLSIENQTTESYACGMSQAINGGSARPLCVFPLAPSSLQTITPLDRVVLFFSTNQLVTGTVFEHPWPMPATALRSAKVMVVSTTTYAIVIDLAGAPDGKRTVSFDLLTSWTWGGGVWAYTLPPTADFVPVLIVKP